MKTKKIFFQGDSITDWGRDRSNNHNLAGYSQLVANHFGNQFEYVNYGISADTSRQLLARHEKEFLKEKADYLVFMIGINDVWRFFDGHLDAAVSEKECVSNITKIIEITRKIKPSVKIIFLEPYLVPGPLKELANARPEFERHWIAIRRSIPQLVDKYVETYEEFLGLTEKGIIVAGDGVHPSEIGLENLANKVINSILYLNR